jgi:hypothetical protein
MIFSAIDMRKTAIRAGVCAAATAALFVGLKFATGLHSLTAVCLRSAASFR